MCEPSSSNNPVPESSDELLISIESHIEDGKNKFLVKCQFCPSHILNPGSGLYKKTEFDLPKVSKRKKAQQDEEQVSYEQLTHFWQVENMYTFENIGFSNTVGNIKYLACADCDVGPIGYFDTDSKISFVALARVTHVD